MAQVVARLGSPAVRNEPAGRHQYRLKQAPGPATPKTIALWVERLEWLGGLIDPDPLLVQLPDRPDLQVFTVHAPAQLTANGTASLDYVVINQGTVPATPA